MQFNLETAKEIIERTPRVLYSLLQGISDEWIYKNEGGDTWSVFDVVGHLIVCEKTDFIPRANIILSDAENKVLAPIDMKAHFEWNKGKDISDLLKEFELLRYENIQQLTAMNLTEEDLQKTAVHPFMGELSLGELMAVWAVHDLNHLSQILSVMAYQYKTEIGPLIQIVSIIK